MAFKQSPPDCFKYARILIAACAGCGTKMKKRPCSKCSSRTHTVPDDVSARQQVVDDIFRHQKNGSHAQLLAKPARCIVVIE